MAVLQCAKLLQLFRLLEGAGRQVDVIQEERSSVGVETDVLPDARRPTRVAQRGDATAGEVEREAPAVHHHLHAVLVVQGALLRSVDHGGHGNVGVLEQGLHRRVDDEALDQGLVSLDVDDDFVLKVQRDLGQAVRARRVVGARHHHLGAEAAADVGDALVVGGHEDRAQGLGRARAFPHAAHHRQAADRGQRLPRKPRGLVPRRNHAHRLHGRHRTRWVHFVP